MVEGMLLLGCIAIAACGFTEIVLTFSRGH